MRSQLCRVPKVWRRIQRQPVQCSSICLPPTGCQLNTGLEGIRSRSTDLLFRPISNNCATGRPLQSSGSTEKFDVGLTTITRRQFQSESEYSRAADECLETIQDTIEGTLEDEGIEAEISYASGVLTMSLPPHGTYVINKQTPNQVSIVGFNANN